MHLHKPERYVNDNQKSLVITVVLIKKATIFQPDDLVLLALLGFILDF